MDEDEARKLIAYLEFQVQSGYITWNQISFYESYAMGFWEADPNLLRFGFTSDHMHKLKQRIKSAAEEALGFELAEVSYHAQKWTEGAFAAFHSDNSDEDGNPTAFERSKFAVFLYLNEDFGGGLLKFQHHDIEIKPQAGLLAIFAGGHTNEHEVQTVTSGTRYTIGSFWDRADATYTDEQRQAWVNELAQVRAAQEEEYKRWNEMKERGERLENKDPNV